MSRSCVAGTGVFRRSDCEITRAWRKETQRELRLTSETAEAETKGGTSEYNMQKKEAEYEQEQMPDRKKKATTSQISQAPEQEQLHG